MKKYEENMKEYMGDYVESCGNMWAREVGVSLRMNIIIGRRSPGKVRNSLKFRGVS